jgi:hypothetical protein
MHSGELLYELFIINIIIYIITIIYQDYQKEYVSNYYYLLFGYNGY